MALRQIMLKKKIDDKKKELEALRAKDPEFEQREAALEASIEEAKTEEEQKAVEDEIGKFEEEKAANDEAKASLEQEVSSLEEELRTIEETDKAQERAAAKPANPEKTEREGKKMADREVRHGYDAIMQREDVKAWIGEIRSCINRWR